MDEERSWRQWIGVIMLTIIAMMAVLFVLYQTSILPRQIQHIVERTAALPSTGAAVAIATVERIANLGSTEVRTAFTDEPFTLLLPRHVWRKVGDVLYGLEFGEDGRLLYLVHGVKGRYTFADVPLDGEHVFWYGTTQQANELSQFDPGLAEGYWLRHFSVRDIQQSWGPTTAGTVDYRYRQEPGHGLSNLSQSQLRNPESSSSP